MSRWELGGPEDQMIRKHWRSGKSDRQIAEIMGCKPSRVWARRELLKLPPHKARHNGKDPHA